MKAIITGAAGFLGSHLTDKLLHEGYKVVGINNLSNPRIPQAFTRTPSGNWQAGRSLQRGQRGPDDSKADSRYDNTLPPQPATNVTVSTLTGTTAWRCLRMNCSHVITYSPGGRP